MEIKPIAKIKNDFDDKFAIPRQSGRVKSVGRIVFEKNYQNPDYIKGIEQFSHLWLIWGFSENISHEESATVRPPRLGGNTRVGVFASRAPFRPNSLGLSCVRLTAVQKTKNGCELIVEGADLMNGTPIYDIKPYVPYSDSINNAEGGYAEKHKSHALNAEIDENLLSRIPKEKQQILIDILKDDPRPAYQNDDKRIYGFSFAGFEIKFRVKGNTIFITDIT